jgi:hypothetical protein
MTKMARGDDGTCMDSGAMRVIRDAVDSHFLLLECRVSVCREKETQPLAARPQPQSSNNRIKLSVVSAWRGVG